MTASFTNAFDSYVVANHSPDLICRFDRELRCNFANRAFLHQVGLSAAEVVGRGNGDLGFPVTSPAGARRWHEELRMVFADGEDRRCEVEHREADGAQQLARGPCTYEARLVAERDATGEVCAVIAFLRDVTKRKRMEEALRRSDENLRFAQRIAHAGSWEWNTATQELHCSDELYRLYGLEPGKDSMEYEAYLTRIHPGDRARVVEALERFGAGGQPPGYDHRIFRADGSERVLHVESEVVSRDDEGRPLRVVGTAQDVTEQRQVAAALREREDWLRMMQFTVDHSADSVFWTDERGDIAYANEAAARFVGRPTELLVGRPYETVCPEFTAERWAAHWQRLREIGSGRFETLYERADGNQLVPVEINAQYLVFRGHPYCSSFARDISDRRRIEEERVRLLESERTARAEAEQANRSKDLFLATLSHELRTPLSTILIWAQLLRERRVDEEKLRQGLAKIEQSARAQKQLIDDLLDVSRMVSGKLSLDVRPVDPAPVLQAAVDSVRHAADGKRIAITMTIEPEVGQVAGDPVRLQQVLWNLLSNAIKFTPEGGHITLRLERVPKGAGPLRREAVRYSVTDTGKGLSPEFIPHLFQRFRQQDSSSTRLHGGLGIGLALSHNLVEMHGGAIRASSPGEGRGATFTVDLPVPERLIEAPPVSPPDDEVALRRARRHLAGMRVLVTDDDPGAREVFAETMALFGAEVRTASSAHEAYSQLTADPPDVLLCDIAMPGEDGYDLIAKVRALAPDEGGRTPAIAVTAFAAREDRERCLSAGFQRYVAKPVEAEVLADTVASVVGR